MLNISRMHRTVRVLTAQTLALLSAMVINTAQASTCPFDTSGSDALNDGIVLTRYALGIIGSPLVASTRYASLDPLQVKNNIECVGCALDMNGDGKIDTVDTTIIARHLMGFKEASLTSGLTLGSGLRSTTAAVTSFLANGCAVGGALNAFTLGGNAFGDVATAAVLGTTDGKPLTVGVGGGSGLRMAQVIDAGVFGAVGGIAVVNGAANNTASGVSVTIAGGGFASSTCSEFIGNANRACGNSASGVGSTISGGVANVAQSSGYATVSGGVSNTAGAIYSSVVGGFSNTATGVGSTVAGGVANVASGYYSFAAGYRAKAVHDYSFVWGAASDYDTTSSAAHQFRVYAPESIRMYASTVPGAGCILSTPSSGWSCSSDRDMKTNIRLLNTVDVLQRVIAMPLSSWSFKGAEAYTHIGPMAQDFSKAFSLGDDDKTISAMDSSGVALAAIQGLHKLLKDKDAKISALEKVNTAIQRDIALMKKRLGM